MMKRNSYLAAQMQSASGSNGQVILPSASVEDENPDTQSSLGNFSSVVVQTPQQSVQPKEMPSSTSLHTGGNINPVTSPTPGGKLNH